MAKKKPSARTKKVPQEEKMSFEEETKPENNVEVSTEDQDDVLVTSTGNNDEIVTIEVEAPEDVSEPEPESEEESAPPEEEKASDEPASTAESTLEPEDESTTVDVVYLGLSEKATAVGKVSGMKYEFFKDEYGMPTPTTVDERDVSSLVALKGKACCGKDPNRLFATKVEWDVELQEAKRINQ